MIVLIIGPSGVGKTTIVNKLLTWENKLEQVVTYTTRDPRKGEKNGIQYNFESVESFENLKQHGRFLETNEFNGNQYGTHRFSYGNIEAKKKVAIQIIDVNGADAIIKQLGSVEDIVSVFIKPPSVEELRKRLKVRGDSPEVIEDRITISEDEIAQSFKYDIVVTNDQVKLCTTKILSHLHEKGLDYI